MNIKGHSLYAEMQTLVQQARHTSVELKSNPATEISTTRSDFGNLLKNAVDNVNALQQESSNLRTAVELGNPNVSLAQAMIASQKASLAFEATVQVRNKVVEAYKEIMSMPV